MNLSPEGLARSAAGHPMRTLLIWAVALIIALGIAGTLFASATTNEQNFSKKPNAQKADDALDAFRPVGGGNTVRRFTETAVVHNTIATVDEPEFRLRVTEIAEKLRALGPAKVISVATYYDTPEPGNAFFVSASRKAMLLQITMTGDFDDVFTEVRDITDSASTGGYSVGVAGEESISRDFEEVSKRDLQVGESIGIGAAIIILLFVFGAVGASWIPIVMAICAIVLAVAASALIGQVYKLSFFVINMISMIGLAVGIDYSLFIIARFKEERAKGVEKVEAVARAGATATRAVVFSGITVVFALLGMLIVPTNIFFSLGLGAILVALAAVALALTLLPALLSVMGDRINAWRLPFISKRARPGAPEGGFWNRVTRTVLARPLIFLLVTATALVALSIPYFSIKKGFNGVETLPDSFESKRAYEVLISEFPQFFGQNLSAVNIVVNGNAGSQDVKDGVGRLAKSLESNPTFGETEAYRVSDGGSVGLLKVYLTVPADSEAANEAVRQLRNDLVGAAAVPSEVLIGGDTAFNVEFFALTDRWQPIVVVFVLSLSFILLTLAFRSIVVPIKAILLNLLSVGAAYGLLVLVFQEGIGADLLGFEQVDVIEAWIPLFLFSVLFGLSMDYEVFLLSRIRERFDESGNNDESVAFGLRSTASIITGAALIMVAVFAGFALGELVMFQQMGFGLGVAVLVDATVIRSVLVPATMKLLGDVNWYMPGWLKWLPDMRVEVKDTVHGGHALAPSGGANGTKGAKSRNRSCRSPDGYGRVETHRLSL